MLVQKLTSRALDAELKVGLGSDIAGGYALSIQTAMREAVVVARLREGARRESVRAHAGETSLTPPTADAEPASAPAAEIPGISDPALADALKEPVSDTYSRQTAKEAQDAGRGPAAAEAEPQEDAKGLRVDWIESLYLATAGGKSSLGFAGVFEPGAEFDAQMSECEHAAERYFSVQRAARGTTRADISHPRRAGRRAPRPARSLRPAQTSRHALVDRGS